MILIVSYDLNNTPNRTPFFDALKQQGPWWHYLTSTWLISTQKTPEQVFSSLAPTMVKEDRLLIFELGKSYNGWLPKAAWDWVERQRQFEGLAALASTPPAPLSPLPPPSPLAALFKPRPEK